MPDTPSRVIVLEAVVAERERQEKVHGIQNHANHFWNVLTTKHGGDVAKQIQEQNESKLFIEVVQQAAVLFAWAEALHLNNKDKWSKYER
tara:strand:+ start:41 stop:310 length:270 start_codon:yes stop_codon:yes gene_type:complete